MAFICPLSVPPSPAPLTAPSHPPEGSGQARHPRALTAPKLSLPPGTFARPAEEQHEGLTRALFCRKAVQEEQTVREQQDGWQPPLPGRKAQRTHAPSTDTCS